MLATYSNDVNVREKESTIDGQFLVVHMLPINLKNNFGFSYLNQHLL